MNKIEALTREATSDIRSAIEASYYAGYSDGEKGRDKIRKVSKRPCPYIRKCTLPKNDKCFVTIDEVIDEVLMRT